MFFQLDQGSSHLWFPQKSHWKKQSRNARVSYSKFVIFNIFLYSMLFIHNFIYTQCYLYLIIFTPNNICTRCSSYSIFFISNILYIEYLFIPNVIHTQRFHIQYIHINCINPLILHEIIIMIMIMIKTTPKSMGKRFWDITKITRTTPFDI